MGIVIVGANHQTAVVDIREQLAFSDEDSMQALATWKRANILEEALILSTCNRVEIVAMSSNQPAEQADRLVELLDRTNSLSEREVSKHIYKYSDDDAVRHVFRVASSLDSLVVGEPQILGQLRKAFNLSKTAGSIGPTLNKLLPHAFHVAKRVRNETDIAGSAVSVSYMAVELGRKIFDSFVGRVVLLIGGGSTAELAARHLMKSGVSTMLFANRTKAKAEQLAASFGGQAVEIDRLVDHLAKADIVICSTSAPDYIITEDMVRTASAKRRHAPIFFIDISVPRNIDPNIGAIENSFVFNIDDLKSMVVSNLDHRQKEARFAELIINQEVTRFREVLRGLEMGPEIARLRKQFREIAQEELARHRSALEPLSHEQQDAVESLLLTVINKISHPIVTQMRQGAVEVEQ